MKPPSLRRRDRHGHGVRGRLVADVTPRKTTRAEVFDRLVLEAIDRTEKRSGQALTHILFAVEDAPPQLPPYDTSVMEDDGVPLARTQHAVGHGPHRASRVVLYRFPLEARSGSLVDLAQLVEYVLAEQLSHLIGVDPDDLR